MSVALFSPNPEEKQRPSRLPLVLFICSVLAVVAGGGGLWWTAHRASAVKAQKMEGLVRAGTPEFDTYLRENKLIINKLERFESESMIGNRYDIFCQVENLGSRTITGLEMRGFVVDFDNKPFVERIIYPIPNQRSTPLKPGEFFPVKMVVDGVKDSSKVMDVRIEVQGIRFAQ